MKRLTINITELDADLFVKTYSAFIQAYGHAPSTAYLNKDTLNELNKKNSDNDISVTYELDPTMSFGEVAFG